MDLDEVGFCHLDLSNVLAKIQTGKATIGKLITNSMFNTRTLKIKKKKKIVKKPKKLDFSVPSD